MLLAQWPQGFADFTPIHFADIGDITARHEDTDGLHLTLGSGEGIIRLFCQAGPSVWGSVVMPIEPVNPARRKVTEWFQALLNGKAHGFSPEAADLTPQLRHYLARLLFLLDARAAGATMQDLAEELLEAQGVTIRGADFADSAQRQRLRHWRRDAEWLVTGGYRDLLAGRWPRNRRRSI